MRQDAAGHDATALAAAVRAGTRSAQELCRASLAAALDADGVFWEVDRAALESARDIDRRAARGEPLGPLAGVPVAVKDSFDVAGLATTVGLRTPVRVADADSAVVARLRAADAVVIGKTAMDQLAWSMTGQAPRRPPCPNPAVPGALPGGSSGGSAAAVAAGIVPLAIGGDTAGSVRVPAAWCQVVGMKFSHGSVALDGCAPLAPSMDCAGVFATSVRDCGLAAEVLGVPGVPGVLGGSGREHTAAHLRIGVPSGLEADGPMDPRVADAFRAALERIADLGHSVAEVGFELRPRGMGRVLVHELAAQWAGRVEPDEPDVRSALGTGTRMESGAVEQAREAVALAAQRTAAAYAGVDVVVLPTAPVPPPPTTEPAAVVDASRFTRAAGAYGWPAISVPLWPESPPVALQLIAPHGKDHQLMDHAEQLWRALAC
ncbi:amidase [Streptomyces sp. NA04227]|uniref:amidase n=1 Tax=Streptomyces sp. NA04227 TaxID=2742136 RepID=UPI0015902D55|nr:amidase [Streptomyces sp. NA04227]QKW09682.1 amidase [Streptomyces sp. NA04227]